MTITREIYLLNASLQAHEHLAMTGDVWESIRIWIDNQPRRFCPDLIGRHTYLEIISCIVALKDGVAGERVNDFQGTFLGQTPLSVILNVIGFLGVAPCLHGGHVRLLEAACRGEKIR